MQCPCGAETKSLKHKVSLPRSVKVWGLDPSQAPIIVDANECTSCGRRATRIYSLKTGELLKEDL